MRYGEFDACIIRKAGTDEVFLRGLLLRHDVRTTLFLAQIKQDLEDLFEGIWLEVLRTPSGTVARGRWDRSRLTMIYVYAREDVNAYVVKKGESFLLGCQVNAVIDPQAYIHDILIDERERPLSFVKASEPEPEWPEGFPFEYS